MDGEQLRQLATNAQLDHWPPHLGVVTEADKIQYLADRLREAGDAEDRADDLVLQLETAQEENQMIEQESDDLKEKIKTLESDIKRLTNKIESIREIIA